ncbi:MAG: hypothetical protein M3385_01180, partial [Actinomycetota bacterium]|nr:hypothetical protein [Actinomycetota bacterium]
MLQRSLFFALVGTLMAVFSVAFVLNTEAKAQTTEPAGLDPVQQTVEEPVQQTAEEPVQQT